MAVVFDCGYRIELDHLKSDQPMCRCCAEFLASDYMRVKEDEVRVGVAHVEWFTHFVLHPGSEGYAGSCWECGVPIVFEPEITLR